MNMREEFIEAFVKQFGFGRMAASSNPDAAGMLACAEWAWFASRELLVIDLPDYLDTDKLGFPAYDADAVDAAIEAAGLKVKP